MHKAAGLGNMTLPPKMTLITFSRWHSLPKILLFNILPVRSQMLVVLTIPGWVKNKDQKPTAFMLTAASHVTQHNYSNDDAYIYLSTSTEPAWSPPKFEVLHSKAWKSW